MPMTLISRTTLTGTAASVTFSSIPQTFQTLKLVISARADAATYDMYVNINSSTANFSYRNLYGSGTAAASASGSNNYIAYQDPSSATASTFGNMEIVIPNYGGSANKAISVDTVFEDNATSARQMLLASLWSVTSSVSSLNAYPSSGNFVANSTFSLYGVS